MSIGSRYPLRTLLAALALLTLLVSPATAVRVSGVVVDSVTGGAVIGANIHLPELEFGVQSDLSGHFDFEIARPGEYTLKLTHISYEPKTVVLNPGDQPVDLHIALLPRTYISDEVVVTGTRTPYLLKDVPVTTEVIRSEDAARTGATTVDQALEAAVGINVDQNFSGTGATLRGLDPTRVLVLIDGEKLVGRVRGAIDLGQISLANVEKIEVVKGVGSTLYGSDAIGGVVNIITRKPQGQTRLNSFAEYGAFKSYVHNAEVESQLGEWDLQLGGRFNRTDGFDLIKETPHTNGLERSNKFNLDGKIGRRLSRSLSMSIHGGFFAEMKKWKESEYIEPLTFTFDDDEHNYRYSGGGHLTYQPNPRTKIDFNAYGTYYDHLWEKFTLSGRQTDRSRTEDYLGEASVVATHSYKEGHVITMGGDLMTQGLTSDEISGGEQDVKSADAYMQYEWKPIDNLVFLPGIRLEHHSTFGEHLNASINAMYNPHERLRLRGFYGGGFRAPSIKEIYFEFDHSAAGYIVTGGGDELKPEKSQNASISIEYSYAGIGLHRITYFYNNIDDMIDFDLRGFSATYWRGIYEYQNVFQAYTRGIEWQSEVKVSRQVGFNLAYTWLTAKNLETGHWLLNRPEHTLKLYSTFDFDKIGLTVTAWGSWQSRKLWVPLGEQNDFESETWAPSRSDISVSIAKRIWKDVELFARGENLTDDVEVDYGYWPARSFYAGIRIRTGAAN